MSKIANHMYAIIDIETTGVSYKSGKITEIAILIHDGTKIVDEFTTLINPEQRIPYRIQQLTGINDRMVEQAPKFFEVAKKIVEMTEDRVFVAHSVSFDYNFIRQEFKSLGYEFNCEKLCTVKLSRKLIPGRRSYSLGKLCDELGIGNPQRHRAYGDALATVKLFEMLLSIDPNPTEISLQGLNSSLKPESIKRLPEEAGVYYFLDDDHNIIYIGKSLNIKSRVMSHLSNNTTKRALEMKNKVCEIDYELTGSELIALLLESHEIAKHLPVYNRAQRRTMFNHGLFYQVDEDGYICFRIGRLDKDESETPLTTFNSQVAAKNFLFAVAEEFQLCQKLCGLYTAKNSCFQYKIKECLGACIGEESPVNYNARARKLVERYLYKNENFVVIDKGRNDDEWSVVHIENGRYMGFGFTEKDIDGFDELSMFMDCVKPYTENKYVHSIIRSYITKHPMVKVVDL